MNFEAIEELEERFDHLDIIFIESGGDNLAADAISSKMEVYHEDQFIGWDHFYLEPKKHRYDAIGVLEHYTHIGTFWIFTERESQELLTSIRELFTLFPNVLMGTSLASGDQGIVVRMLGSHNLCNVNMLLCAL